MMIAKLIGHNGNSPPSIKFVNGFLISGENHRNDWKFTEWEWNAITKSYMVNSTKNDEERVKLILGEMSEILIWNI